jgi:hypothetical protein
VYGNKRTKCLDGAWHVAYLQRWYFLGVDWSKTENNNEAIME